jgi:hypothetical protein
MILAHLIAGPTAILGKPLGPESSEPPADGLGVGLATEASSEIAYKFCWANDKRGA